MANGDEEKRFERALASANKVSQLAKQIDDRHDSIIGSQTKQLEIAQNLASVNAQIEESLKAGDGFVASSLKTEKERLEAYKDINKLQDKAAKTFGVLNDQAQALVGNIQGFVEKLPGGKMLSKAFGIDQLGDAMSKSLNKAASVMAQGGGMTKAMSAFGSSMAALVNPVTIVAAIIAGLVMTFINFEKKAKGVAEATGLTLAQSKALVKESKKVATSMGHQLATSEDILAVQKSTISEFGIASMLTAEQAGNVAEIGKSFSIGAKAASDVTNEFLRMGMTGEEAADALLNVSAEAFKAGVSVGAVTKDIAANAKATAKYFGSNVKALRKAAVEAAKLGVNLQTMVNVADNLLNFEDSIAAQFEFQAMTGKQINFDKARQLALDGKIAEATKEVLSNVGSLSEFEAMRPMAQRQLAKATGMTVDELTKSMAIQEKLGVLNKEEQAAAASLGLSAAEMKNMSAEELKNKLAQQQTTDKMAAKFSQLTDELTTALIPAGQALMQVFEMLMPIIKLIGLSFKQIGRLLDAVIVKPMKRAKGLLEGISDIFAGDFEEGFKKLGKGIIAVFTAPMQLIIDLVMNMINSSIDLINLIPGVNIGEMKGFEIADQVGDLGIDPNGGPVVMSPSEGGLFQGTSNDGVSMSPSHGTEGGGMSGLFSKSPLGMAAGFVGDLFNKETPASQDGVIKAIESTNALLRELISNGTTIEMDGQLVGQTLRTTDSFRRK
jgi:hypothetical protein